MGVLVFEHADAQERQQRRLLTFEARTGLERAQRHVRPAHRGGVHDAVVLVDDQIEQVVVERTDDRRAVVERQVIETSADVALAFEHDRHHARVGGHVARVALEQGVWVDRAFRVRAIVFDVHRTHVIRAGTGTVGIGTVGTGHVVANHVHVRVRLGGVVRQVAHVSPPSRCRAIHPLVRALGR